MKIKFVFLITVVLTILTNCSLIPATPRLPLAVKPSYPILNENELMLLGQCQQGDSVCAIYRKTLNKIAHKDQLCRNYARELRSVIVDNNAR